MISKEFKELLEKPKKEITFKEYANFIKKEGLMRKVGDGLKCVEFIDYKGVGYQGALITSCLENEDQRKRYQLDLNIERAGLNFEIYLAHLITSENPKTSPSLNVLNLSQKDFIKDLESEKPYFQERSAIGILAMEKSKNGKSELKYFLENRINEGIINKQRYNK
jgi:hypothetical protein